MLPETFPIDSLSAYTNVSMTTDTLRTSQLFKNLPTVFEVRMPTLWPVPPRSSPEEVFLEDETPYECLHVNSWHSHENRTFFQPIIDVSTAPVDEPTVMSFTIPLTGNTIVTTAAVVITCSATPTCSGDVCVAMSCGGGSFTPDGAYDSLWDNVKPMTGSAFALFLQ